MTRRCAILPACAAAALIVTAIPAWAHAHLLSETPAADATGPSPARLDLTFSEGVELKFTTVVLKGPNGSAATTGAAGLLPGDPRHLIVPVTGRLMPGRYTVDWHAVAIDGHRTTGTYGFTVSP